MPVSSRIRRSTAPETPSIPEPLIPGDDTVWETYSANGEPLLSGLASLVIHGVVLLVLVSGLAALFQRRDHADLEPFPPLLIGDGEPGGLGNPQGGDRPAGQSAIAPQDERDLEPDRDPTRLGVRADDADVVVNPNSTRLLDPEVEIRRKMRDTLAAAGDRPRIAVKGPIGQGAKGPGNDNTIGPRRKPSLGGNERGERVLRWELVFTTSDARHYLQQLEALGAVVAVPDHQGKLKAIANLKERPARLEDRDVTALNRIYWVDDRRESAESVAAELGLDFTPSAVVAFFPHELELQLVAKEKAYGGRKEADIELTRFAVSFKAGAPVVRVIEQKAKKPRR